MTPTCQSSSPTPHPTHLSLPSFQIERRVLQASLRFLALLHEENHKEEAKATRLPYEEFYIPEIAEKIDIRNDYLNWIRSKTLASVKIDVCFQWVVVAERKAERQERWEDFLYYLIN